MLPGVLSLVVHAVPFHILFRAPEEAVDRIVAEVNHFSVQN